MVWFICDSCGDSIKKPKVAKHLGSCAAWSFTCIDCQRTFDRKSVHNHINCVSEKEKYVDGATKPGGFAAKGYADGAVEARAQVQIEGGEYLSQRPPWMCSLCKVTCTSRDNLLNHAHSKGHTKKAKKASVADGAAAKQDHTLGGLGGTDLGSSSRDVAEQTAASADPCPEKNDRMRKELGSAKEDERSKKSSKKRKALHPADAAYIGQCSADSPAGSKKHKRKCGIVTQVAAKSALSLGRETAKDSAGPNKAVDALQEDEALVGANAVAKKLKKAKKREPGACGGHLKAGLLGNGVVKKKAMKKMARAAACQENGAVLAEDGKEVKKAKKSESKGVVDRENGSMLEDGDAQKEKKKKKSRKRKSKVDVEEQVGGSERIESGKEAKAKQKKKKKERKAADS